MPSVHVMPSSDAEGLLQVPRVALFCEWAPNGAVCVTSSAENAKVRIRTQCTIVSEDDRKHLI